MKKGKRKKIIITAALILIVISLAAVFIVNYYNSKNQHKGFVKDAKQVNAATDNKNTTKNDGSSSKEVKTPVFNNETDFTNKALVNNDKSIPILMYHCVDTLNDPKTGQPNELYVPKEKFEEQMQYLKDNGYTTLTMNQLYDFFQNNKQVPEKSVVITLDDGYENNYVNAFPILKKFNFTATIFVITNMVDKSTEYLSSNQIKEMSSYGLDMEPHTLSHPHLTDLKYVDQLKELKESKEYMEKLLNKPADFIAYPYGSHSQYTLKAATEAGYKLGFTIDGPWANKKNGLLTLNRVYVNAAKSMDVFKYRLSNPNYE